MPLSEFLRMAGQKMESSQQRPCPTDLSSVFENDLLELILENGQIMMQGQSNKVKKFGGVESMLNDISPVVPSGDLNLSQVDNETPWLDALVQDYSSVLIPEISVATCNGVVPDRNSKLSSVSNFINNINTSNHSRTDVVFSSPPTNNGSNYVNFSHFARPANLVKGKLSNSSVKGVKEKHSDASGINSEKINEPIVASSVGSGNSADRVSYEQTLNSKRKFRDTEESECHSDDVETNSVDLEKPTRGRGSGGSKRSRAAEVHNLSERRRRDRINEKMRALQELIPNCNKADKASMLDGAIEYLKTLQLQVQIMSMGAGICMFPSGMHHIPHFSTMGPVGMGMLDMNGGSPVFPNSPLHAPHFSSPMPPTCFQRMAGHNLLVYGHPGQGLPNSVPRPPVFLPLSGQLAVNEVPSTPPVLNSGDITNSDSLVNCNAILIRQDKQPTDFSGRATSTDTRKESGEQ